MTNSKLDEARHIGRRVTSLLCTTCILATSALGLGATPAAARQDSAYDHVQFTENLIWCYQQQDRVQTVVDISVRISDGIVVQVASPSLSVGTVPRSWYIRAIRAAAAARDVGALRAIYGACQAHNSRAMAYLRGEPDINLVRAARYTVACKPDSVGGATPAFCSRFQDADSRPVGDHGGGYDMEWPVSLL